MLRKKTMLGLCVCGLTNLLLAGCHTSSGSSNPPAQTTGTLNLTYTLTNDTGNTLSYALQSTPSPYSKWTAQSSAIDQCFGSFPCGSDIGSSIEPNCQCSFDDTYYVPIGKHSITLSYSGAGTCTSTQPSTQTITVTKYNTTQLDFGQISCPDHTTLLLKATNTQDTTTINLKAQQLGLNHTKQHSIKPITLTRQNNHNQTIKLDRTSSYHASVHPLVTNDDKIPSNLSTITAKTQNVTVNFEPSKAHLVTQLAISQLANALSQNHPPFNQLLLTGLLTNNGQLNKTAQSTLINTPIPTYITPLISINRITDVATVLAAIPDTKGIALTTTKIDDNWAQQIKAIQANHPNLIIALNVTNILPAADLNRLSKLINSKNRTFQGWVLATPDIIKQLTPVIDPQYLVVNTNELKKAALKRFLSQYPTMKQVNGLMIKPQAISKIQKIKDMVLARKLK